MEEHDALAQRGAQALECGETRKSTRHWNMEGACTYLRQRSNGDRYLSLLWTTAFISTHGLNT
eukprot:946555-Pelagomonas_calceolata.AAC.8